MQQHLNYFAVSFNPPKLRVYIQLTLSLTFPFFICISCRYDSMCNGSCSLEELKRGLKHLKTLVPPFNQQDLSVLADAFPSDANPDQVSFNVGRSLP